MVSISPRQKIVPRQRIRMVAGMRLSRILSVEETAFANLVKEVVSDTLFQNLSVAGAIKRRRFPGVSVAPFRTIPFSEGLQTAAPRSPSGNFPISATDREIPVTLLKKIGRQNFVSFFLAPEESLSFGTIAERCGLTITEVKKISEFTDKITLGQIFTAPTFHLTPGRTCKVVAMIEDDGTHFTLADLSFDLVFGQFSVDQERLKNFKNSLSKEERKRLNLLLDNIRLINSRRTALYSLLKNIIQYQEKFLRSNHKEDLLPLSQRGLAKQLGFSASAINRAVKSRAVKLPDGSVFSLSSFFVTSKEWKKRLVAELLAEKGGERISDRRLQKELTERLRLKVSRRSINLYRRELNLHLKSL